MANVKVELTYKKRQEIIAKAQTFRNKETTVVISIRPSIEETETGYWVAAQIFVPKAGSVKPP